MSSTPRFSKVAYSTGDRKDGSPALSPTSSASAKSSAKGSAVQSRPSPAPSAPTIALPALSEQIQRLEASLPAERRRLDQRKRQLDTSQHVTRQIIETLGELEPRIAERETVFVPLHRATQNLRRIEKSKCIRLACLMVDVEDALEVVGLLLAKADLAVSEDRILSTPYALHCLF